MTSLRAIGIALVLLPIMFVVPVQADELPAVFDLCKFQSSIRNQGARDVCPYFPPVAALEAAFRHKGENVNLSEEHLIWLRNVTCAADKGNRDVAENLLSTLGGGNGMGVLRDYAICRAEDLPYRGDRSAAQLGSGDYYKGFDLGPYDWSKPNNQFLLNRWNMDPQRLPPAARANARYAIQRFTTFPRKDLQNPRKFEEVLHAGHEIVFAINIHRDSDDAAKGEPVWRLKPNTASDTVNHFMLMVGYDRSRHFFVVKNQWGPTSYTAMKARLAKGWEDVVRYDGYTLVDYNYLGACSEAHYITEVAPTDSPRFVAQRGLGQWEVAFKCQEETVMTGVLCWRHLPDSAMGEKANLRLGDLVTKDGQQYRVNARLDRLKPDHITLYIDFQSGALPVHSTQGAAFAGTLNLPDQGACAMQLHGVNRAKHKAWDKPVGELEMTATLCETKNLLMALSPPK